MHVDIKGVHLDVSEKMREEIGRKLEHLDFAKDMITDLLFTICREKAYQVEAQINFRWGSSAHISTETFDVFEGINALFDKIDHKVRKEKEKIQDHSPRGQ
jgi:putative sigma-54 modulation protein